MKSLLLSVSIFACLGSQAQDSVKSIHVDFGVIEFEKNSAELTEKAKENLDSVAVNFNAPEPCRLLISSISPTNCKKCVALSVDRYRAVANYLKQRGIAANRLDFSPNVTDKSDGNFVFLSLTINCRN